MTTGKVHEQKVAPSIPLDKGDVVVFDKGFTDFQWYATLCQRGIYFVTRLKINADYLVVERRKTNHLKNISSDQIIQFQGVVSRKNLPYNLRRIRSKDPQTGKYIVLLTNQFEWSANTIAQIYKDRWQIEIFFKALKQNLKVKTFVGTSDNVLYIQIWTAMK